MRDWSAIAGIPIEVPDLARLARAELRAMRAAGAEVRECYRVLAKGEANVVGEVLRGQETFYEDDHYPEGDVYDADTGSQYYYHAHRGLPGEHGHFHTFLRAAGMPPGVAPVPHAGGEPWPVGDEAIAHLAAVSMDRSGYPLGLFMTNRWVTGEAWYAAADAIRMLDRFEMDLAVPSWATNRWLTAMLRLFRVELGALLQHRDAVIAAWTAAHPGADPFEDRELETTGWLRISVDDQIARIEAALA